MNEVFVINGIRVVVDQSTGRVLAVHDAETGATADQLWTRAEIDAACAEAHTAWASTIECCA